MVTNVKQTPGASEAVHALPGMPPGRTGGRIGAGVGPAALPWRGRGRSPDSITSSRCSRARVAAAWSLVLTVALLPGAPARADIARFDLSGKLYTKWLYQNDDSQGVLTHGNPFWPENITGNNGIGSEFELKVMGAVSNAVSAEVRLKSRFGALWQDWWENGDQAYDEVNTSGESMGMNHAEYIKLRGYRVQATLPFTYFPTSIVFGSSDLGMFNPWTIGKVRYIDRDNAKGFFLIAGTRNGVFRFVQAAIALPKLFVGPGWSTGIGDPNLLNPFYSRDWAFGQKLELSHPNVGTFSLVGSMTTDIEINVADPDAQGSLYPSCTDVLGNPIPQCVHDHAVDTVPRYTSGVVTLQYKGVPLAAAGADWLVVDHLLAVSAADINEDVTFNGVAGNAGVSPIVYRDITDARTVFETAHAAVGRVDMVDFADWSFSAGEAYFEFNPTLRLEGFSIGENFNSIFGARREADVLLTDGFVSGGQLPTLNLANEFIDFDEAWYESCIGWYGATLVQEIGLDTPIGTWTIDGETTYIGYHTNQQERDVENVYPDFLHTDGFTDTELYDYANTSDRGRDLRSVYRRNQDRNTFIGRARLRYDVAAGAVGIHVAFLEFKGIADWDARSHTTRRDDYFGQRLQFATGLSLDAAGFRGALGGEIQLWDETNRRGTLELGYGDDTTFKAKAFLKIGFTWSGLFLGYYLEFLHKNQQREREPDQLWDVVRSKATMEVAW